MSMPLFLFSSHLIYLLPEFPLEETVVEPSFREVLKDALRTDDLYLALAHRCRPFARRKTLMRKAAQIRQALPHVMRVDPVELAWRGLELEDEEKFAKSIELKIQGLHDAPL